MENRCMGDLSTLPNVQEAISFPLSALKKCHVCSFTNTEVLLRAIISSAEEAEEFVTDLSNHSGVTWRVTRTQPEVMSAGQKNLFWKMYHCHSSNVKIVEGKGHHRKHTGCQATMTITVKKVPKRCRSKDVHNCQYPCIIKVKYNHNHRLMNAESLSLRDVGSEIKTKFLQLYENGHTPSAALDAYKLSLQIQHGDRYYQVAADRSICPDLQWCYRLYNKVFEVHYGGKDDLSKKLKDIQSLHPGVEVIEKDDQLVVIIVSPLMKRVHSLVQQSSEIVFMDSCGNVDRHNVRVFLLLTHSNAGGLPLATFITTSETEEVISIGLESLKKMLGNAGFYGRGAVGPQVFMTDDCKAEINSLHTAFPHAKTILCVFHVLQALWRYLWDANHKIEKLHRQHLLQLIKGVVYADTLAELDEKFRATLADETVQLYDHFIEHVKKLYERRSEWALCLRKDLPIRSANTNNYAEAAVKVLKENILHRTKAYNLPQLVDFILTDLENYYVRKIADVAANRYLPVNSMIAMFRKKAENLIVSNNGNSIFTVQNEGKSTYTVDMNSCLCTCYVGRTGGPCKHQFAVVNKFQISSSMLPPCDSKQKQLLHVVAFGSSSAISDNWYSPLKIVDQEVCDQNQDADRDLQLESVDVQDRPVSNSSKMPHVQLVPVDTSVKEQSDLKALEEGWQQLSATLMRKLNEQPDSFAPAVTAFLKTWRGIKTDSGLVSSLHTFGKEVNSRRSAARRILVQATAVARRKTAVGGRLCIQSGRPRKPMSACDHIYQKMKMKTSVTSQILPGKRHSAAPHNLSYCVTENRSLGKTH